MPATAQAQRGMVPVDAPTVDDVIDRYMQTHDVYQRSARAIAPAVEGILKALSSTSPLTR
jgi:hypothetical protein